MVHQNWSTTILHQTEVKLASSTSFKVLDCRSGQAIHQDSYQTLNVCCNIIIYIIAYVINVHYSIYSYNTTTLTTLIGIYILFTFHLTFLKLLFNYNLVINYISLIFLTPGDKERRNSGVLLGGSYFPWPRAFASVCPSCCRCWRYDNQAACQGCMCVCVVCLCLFLSIYLCVWKVCLFLFLCVLMFWNSHLIEWLYFHI